jgi:hypothetical protein
VKRTASLLAMIVFETASSQGASAVTLEEFLRSLDQSAAHAPSYRAFVNGAENLPVAKTEGFEQITVDGSILNSFIAQPGGLLDFVARTNAIGNMSSTVTGSTNQASVLFHGDVTATQTPWPDAVSGQTVAAHQIPVFGSNFASNQVLLSGAVTADFMGIAGSIGEISTSVIGALNTGTVAVRLRTLSDNILYPGYPGVPQP